VVGVDFDILELTCNFIVVLSFSSQFKFPILKRYTTPSNLNYSFMSLACLLSIN